MAGWLVVGVLAALVGARLAAWDATGALVAVNSVTPVVFLPAWAIGLAALLGRRLLLFAASAVVASAHVLLVLPELAASSPVPEAARTAPTFRVFDANVQVTNSDVTALAAEMVRAQPDVIILQEATPTLVARLEAAGAFTGLPHRLTIDRIDPFAALMVARWPLRQDDVLRVEGRPVAIRATVEVGGTDVRLYGVHVRAPFGGDREIWMRDIEGLGAAVAAERAPVLVAGDFNATWGHRPFRRLLDTGLTDAAAARGSALTMTWPRDLRLLPPLARIDHVLTTAGLVVTRIAAGEGRGSDHRPLIAEVAVV